MKTFVIKGDEGLVPSINNTLASTLQLRRIAGNPSQRSPCCSSVVGQVPPRLACRRPVTLSQLSGDFGQPSIENITLRVAEMRGPRTS